MPEQPPEVREQRRAVPECLKAEHWMAAHWMAARQRRGFCSPHLLPEAPLALR